ncbi:MAG: WD40 repeat domain-containing protein, partial [Nitrospiraceae bacterium]
VMDPAMPQDTMVNSLVFNPDSHTSATTFWSGALGKQEIVRYEVEADKPLRVFEPPTTPRRLITANVGFSPDGHYLVNARSGSLVTVAGEGRDNIPSVIDVWDLRTGGLHTIQGVHVDKILALAIAHQGTTVATGSYGWGSISVRNPTTDTWEKVENHEFIKLWDSTQGVLIKELTTELPGASRPTYDLDFSPDGNYLVSCQGAEVSQGDTIWLWEISSGTILQKFRTSPGATYSGVRSCAFSPDGSRIAAVGGDELIIIDLKWEK